VLSWLTVQADYQSFDRVDKTRPAFKLNGTTALGSGTGSSASNIGQEIDLTAKMKASAAVGFSLGVSEFLPGSYVREQLGHTDPNFIYAQLETKF
jgi:hypothetical protein